MMHLTDEMLSARLTMLEGVACHPEDREKMFAAMDEIEDEMIRRGVQPWYRSVQA
jgi:hypothetical protein